MAVNFITDDAQALLKKFEARLSQKDEKGKITTWEKSDDGKYYTHKARDWHKLAWFKPKITHTALVFNIIKPQNKDISNVVYAYYHGHLIETFLTHFDQSFSVAEATALPTSGDKCSS